jgi:hypothetical protein
MPTYVQNSLVCPLHGIHHWIPWAARGLARQGKTDQQIFDRIRAATLNARRHVPEREIREAIAIICATPVDSKLGHPREQNAEYEPHYLEEIAARIADIVDAKYLEVRSQFTTSNRTPAGFLHKLFRPGENVWVTVNDKSSDGWIWTHDGDNQNFAELADLESGQENVFFLTNPIDGELHAVPRRVTESNPEGLTFRATECVTAWRYMVVESDVAPRDLWLRALVQFELPIVAIYTSGGRSIHALLRLNADSKAHWEEICQKFQVQLIRLGACPGSLNAVRLSRLPNCIRGETGSKQALLYLSPDADSTPICQRSIRTAQAFPGEPRTEISHL